MSFIAVVGSAHLDILSTIVGDVEPIDKIGKLSIHFGGTAYNIAINLSNLGENVRFISGMKRSPFTSLILDNLKEHKIEPWVIQQENIPLGGFAAQLWNGELISAVSSMPVETIHFDHNFIVDALSGAKAIILECNLSPLQIQLFASVAKTKNIPVFISSVSEEKSLRLKMVRAP
ncbi:MAG TPA: PfkB family carbohydrate kinase, partial [Ignavibacteriaceae bacterium]